jgi:hypothetical protein
MLPVGQTCKSAFQNIFADMEEKQKYCTNTFFEFMLSYAAIFKESYHSLFKVFPSQQDFIDANGKIDNRKVPSCYHCWRKKMHENLLFFLS